MAALPRRSDETLEIPDHLGSEVTFDQKKRLARLARMGIGQVPGVTPRAAAAPAQTSSSLALTDRSSSSGSRQSSSQQAEARLQERRIAMVEQDRRARAEEAQREEEEREKQERLRKAGKNRAGLQSLGAVEVRSGSAAAARYPTPASSPAESIFVGGPPKAPLRKMGGMAIKISASTAEKVATVPAEQIEAPAALKEGDRDSRKRSRSAEDSHETRRTKGDAISSIATATATIEATTEAPEHRHLSPQDKSNGNSKSNIKPDAQQALAKIEAATHSSPAPPEHQGLEAPEEQKSKIETSSKEALSGLSLEAQVLAELRAMRRQVQARIEREAREEEERKKKQGKKRKKTKRKESSGSEVASESTLDEEEVSEEEDSHERHRSTAQSRKQSRDGGISWKMMDGGGESVKARISNDNKRMTDADLERRFGAQDSHSSSKGLMSEQEVKAMLQKEKKSSGGGSGARAQKEAEEWQKAKEKQIARGGFGQQERLVVNRK
eukprot:TRINITY_DN4144_c0_g1_i1.p1 TRINITY_DN4144_c0_g1~~TRINITY_DN4144_c0_g1_i1.p1  ORF type:complete len:529 (-),score=148.82 TRINITY_DN4144_c0_g1_i1:307-1794(-)